MEQIEVIPKTLDTDNNENDMDDSSNPTTVDPKFNSNIYSTAPPSKNESSSTVIEELEVRTDNCDDSVCPKFNVLNLAETLGKLSINNASATDVIQDETSHDLDTKDTTEACGTAINKCEGNSKSGGLSADESRTIESACEQHTEYSRKHLSLILDDTEANSSRCAHPDNSVNTKDNINKTKESKVDEDDIGEEQLHGASEDKSENNHGKNSDIVKKESDNNLQSELKQQSSEIKERVMGFLTKYTKVDETSCSSEVSSEAYKKECVEGTFHDMNEKNITSKIVSEEPNLKISEEKYNPRSLDCTVGVENSADSNFMSYSKFMFHSGSKSKLLPWEFVPAQESLNMTTQFSDEKDQKKVVPECSLQTDKSLLSLPTRCENECDPQNTDTEMESLESKYTMASSSDAFIYQQKMETMLRNNFGLGILQSSHQFDSNLQEQNNESMIDTHSKESKIRGQQTSLSANAFSPNSPINCNNHNHTFLGMKTPYASSSKYETYPYTFNGLCDNDTSILLQRNNNNAVSVNPSFASWEKISFQPHTTASIKSPIFSSKSCNDHNFTKCTIFSENGPINKLQTDNEDIGASMLSSNGSPKSRRTKSTDEMLFSMPFALCIGGSTLLNNKNNNPMYCGKTGETLKTNVSALGCVKASCTMNAFSENKTKENPCTILGDYLQKPENLSDSISYRNSVASSPFEGNTDNPFSKRLPVQSIGLFSSPIKSVVSGVGNSAFKPVSSLPLFAPMQEKVDESIRFLSNTAKSEQVPSIDQTQFVFQTNPENRQNQNVHTSTKFVFDNVFDKVLPSSTAKPIFGCGHTSIEDNKQSPFVNSIRTPAPIIDNVSPFQFKFNTEKKSSCGGRRTWSWIKKPIRPDRQFEKGFSKSTKEDENTSRIPEKVHWYSQGTEDVPFKPVYGSDTKMERGINKSVFIRYQNIVFMDEYAHVSPEELRTQFYAKTLAMSGPFQFSASVESNEKHNNKKTQSQETQTDDHLSNHSPDLSGIWRVLECPVCLDVVLPPVYQCEQGHHACLTCWKKVVKCPLCKRHKSVTRNYMGEALVEQVPLPCKYHIEGCKETVQHTNKVVHEEMCSYRMYQCPANSCNQAHSYQNMCKHFNKVHKSILHHEGHSIGKGEKFCDVLFKDVLSVPLVHAFNITKWGLFFLRGDPVQKSTALFVQVMPATSDQAEYFYHLEVCDHHDCRKECYKGRVFSVGKSTKEIVDQEEYLCLSELITKTVKKTTPLKIIVTIWQFKVAFTISGK